MLVKIWASLSLYTARQEYHVTFWPYPPKVPTCVWAFAPQTNATFLYDAVVSGFVWIGYCFLIGAYCGARRSMCRNLRWIWALSMNFVLPPPGLLSPFRHRPSTVLGCLNSVPVVESPAEKPRLPSAWTVHGPTLLRGRLVCQCPTMWNVSFESGLFSWAVSNLNTVAFTNLPFESSEAHAQSCGGALSMAVLHYSTTVRFIKE